MGVTDVSYIEDVFDRAGVEDATVSVTPVSPGVTRPWILLMAVVASTREVVDVVRGLGPWQPWLYLVVAGPVALVAVVRTARWRSHKVHVHAGGITVQAGLGRRTQTTLSWDDIGAVDVERGLHDRLTARGLVVVETATGPWVLGLVRHPLALARVIEAQRHAARAALWSRTPVDPRAREVPPTPTRR